MERVEVITRVERRRKWSEAEKAGKRCCEAP